MVKPDIVGKPEGRITKLSGRMGEEELQLYVPGENHFYPSTHIGMALKVSNNRNIGTFSVPAEGPQRLLVGDQAVLYFDNGDSMSFRFMITSYKHCGRRQNHFILSDEQLMYLTDNPLNGIELTAAKSGIATPYQFNEQPTHQYTTPKDGRKLLMILAKRVAGTKVLITIKR
ncbi:hypothetical protein [Chitinophaga sp. sic0106]|uniref:hypothetical protein n=1 Tax=Chitinophaga sp. sic0106 TaxID=2854785 RepID=UPI001C496085|nr:hypothetical protein [Chitinophaga sp. sic0106]MBV7531331.1 hypothetical protein [Chitinophaga sp. sic0106]